VVGTKDYFKIYNDAKQQAIKSKKKFIIPEGYITIQIDDFQKYFYPSYCITCHKSQGSTIDESYTIHEFNKMHHKLRYVALSRATKLENINII
jgi:ATP-dependent exoDNAse (exonuclease V) alpha subunit